MTDGQKLARLLDHMDKFGRVAFNVEGGFGFDRVARKARENGLIVTERVLMREKGSGGYPVTWTYGTMTDKGRERLARLRKTGKVPGRAPYMMTEEDYRAYRAQFIGRTPPTGPIRWRFSRIDIE